jgi:hypothetical protein
MHVQVLSHAARMALPPYQLDSHACAQGVTQQLSTHHRQLHTPCVTSTTPSPPTHLQKSIQGVKQGEWADPDGAATQCSMLHACPWVRCCVVAQACAASSPRAWGLGTSVGWSQGHCCRDAAGMLQADTTDARHTRSEPNISTAVNPKPLANMWHISNFIGGNRSGVLQTSRCNPSVCNRELANTTSMQADAPAQHACRHHPKQHAMLQ